LEYYSSVSLARCVLIPHYPTLPALAPALLALKDGLIVSCQADAGSPFRDSRIIAAFARGAEAGGARAVRVAGLEDLEAVRDAVTLPVIGLTKRQVPGYDVYITPTPAEVTALARGGAFAIAFDATLRARPHPVAELVAAAHENGVLAMADCATLADAEAAVAAGADIVGTTLSGYTPDSPQLAGPDFDFIAAASRLGVPLIAEGRISSPAEAKLALDCGAFAVVVGTAITRPDVVTGWYSRALAEREMGRQP
jgi:N-acylglucosamine-6-phosphate 2-epimerase